MHYVTLEAGQADVSQTRSSSLRTRVKDVVTRAGGTGPPVELSETTSPAGRAIHVMLPLQTYVESSLLFNRLWNGIGASA